MTGVGGGDGKAKAQSQASVVQGDGGEPWAHGEGTVVGEAFQRECDL